MAVTVEKKTTERFSFEMREGEIVFDEGFVAATEGATVSIVEVAPACGRVTRLTMAIGSLFSGCRWCRRSCSFPGHDQLSSQEFTITFQWKDGD